MTKKSDQTTKADETPEFVAFWETWRPHARAMDGRGLARNTFVKHVKAGADPQDIVDGTRYFFRTLSEKDRDYIPLSSTWLNRSAYEDLCIKERAYQQRVAEMQAKKAQESDNVIVIQERRQVPNIGGLFRA